MHKQRTVFHFVGGLLAPVLTASFLFCAVRSDASRDDDDEKVVAEMDSEYQAAVKRNDVSTMARILADDFVLVTGRGRTQTKSDLLKESGSGEIVYATDGSQGRQ